jgi:hypothetical protein
MVAEKGGEVGKWNWQAAESEHAHEYLSPHRRNQARFLADESDPLALEKALLDVDQELKEINRNSNAANHGP